MEDATEDNVNCEPEDLTLADDAVPLCPVCLHPCDRLDLYCPHCGSNEAINPLASYMPFVDLRLRIGMVGKLWRRLWDAQTAPLDRVVSAGVFLLFFPWLLLIGLPFALYEKLKAGDASGLPKDEA